MNSKSKHGQEKNLHLNKKIFNLNFNWKKKSTKAQMKISFGMIFSIILIIVFIAFAFYAIKKFLDIQETAQIETFVNKLQGNIDKMWRSSQGSEEIQYKGIPKKISI